MDRIKSHQTLDYRGATPSFRRIAEECGVVPSTFTRLESGKGIDGRKLVSILLWLVCQKGETWEKIMRDITKAEKRTK